MFEPNTELLEWFADGMPITWGPHEDADDLDDETDGAPAPRPDAIPAPPGEGVSAGGLDARQAA